MAATRNKFMYNEFCVSAKQVKKQQDMSMALEVCANDRPAWPVRLNAPHMPSTVLANNAIDIESSLRGIGANNFVYPRKPVTPQQVTLPPVRFYDEKPVYVPVLPDMYERQRPTNY